MRPTQTQLRRPKALVLRAMASVHETVVLTTGGFAALGDETVGRFVDVDDPGGGQTGFAFETVARGVGGGGGVDEAEVFGFDLGGGRQ